MKKLKVILIGAGNRGNSYSKLMVAHPDMYEVVGVAEPIKVRNDNIKNMFNIPEENCYESWEQILDRPKFADYALIATQDAMHFDPAMKALELGYDLMLEKPMTPTPEQSRMITETAERLGRKVVICHVLRYTKLYKGVKQVLDSGRLGDIVSVQWLEPVGHKHMSHSFVRGHWSNKEESAPMILAKSCHDLDAIQWLIGKKCEKLSSFGSLMYFRKENKPEGAPERCIDGCPHEATCPYDTKKLYLGERPWGGNWFRSAATDKVVPTDEEVMDAMRNTQYGKCVFSCNNNVVDHQVVNMFFEGGTTVSMTMSGPSPDGAGRMFKFFCTKGTLEVGGNNNIISITEFSKHEGPYLMNKVTEEIDVTRVEDTNGISLESGHGGGDGGIVAAIYEDFNGVYEGCSLSTARDSYRNHLLSWAAEESRLAGGKVIDLDEFAAQH